MGVNERNISEKSRKDVKIQTKDFILGAFVGGLVGAATALFLNPKSGKELRNFINNQTENMIGSSGKLREAAFSQGNKLKTGLKEKTIDISDVVSKQKSQIFNKGKQTMNDMDDEPNKREGIILSNYVKKDDIQRKLEETKKAFDDTERKINH